MRTKAIWNVFPDEGERFFASFAIPGVRAGQRNTTIYECHKADVEHARKTMPKEAFLKVWEECNDSLRDIGMRLIPLDE